jgi:hypothetical protein
MSVFSIPCACCQNFPFKEKGKKKDKEKETQKKWSAREEVRQTEREGHSHPQVVTSQLC